LSYDLLNIDKLDSKLSVKSVSLNKTEVVVKGSESSLEKIASVKALIDLNKEKFTTAGTFDISDVPLVAYDNNGQILDNIDIVPNTVSASVTLESYSASVPLKVETTGSLIAGKAIASISMNNSSTYNLTIYGEKTDIDSITSVPVTINVDGLGKDASKTYNVSLTKPNGVRYMSAKTVTIAVTFGNEEQKTVDIGNKITQKNLGDGLVANIISNDAVTVQVKGVASVINDITDSNINAYVDLDSLGVGEHEVEVKIDNDNPLVNYVVSSRIKINITNK
jgi:YbbR domain-containing protein